MHMADALVSPLVGVSMWAVSAGLIGYSAKKVSKEADDRKIPLMGVLGAFIFASQMINFSIPGTGSSGHLGGGMILSILLGPYAAFLVMASVLTVQSLFFADGGLLALGCNIFNLGFFPCFIMYPFVYRRIVGNNVTQKRIVTGAFVAAILGLQFGACGVVLETLFSGISDLPFTTFILMMQSIHLVIGVVEGFVTSAVVIFVWKARPEILNAADGSFRMGKVDISKVLLGLTLAAVVLGGALSWFASSNPDGLEWAMFKVSGKEEITATDSVYQSLAAVQEKTALLPGYGFKNNQPMVVTEEKVGNASETTLAWPAVELGTSVSGLVGGALTLLLAVGIGLVLVRRKVSV